jgi:anti-anti-sigma factor
METAYHHLKAAQKQGVLILTLLDEQIRGDELADALSQEMLAAAQEAGTNKVVIDMARVTYMSTVGFRPLLRVQKMVKEAGGRVVLCNLHPVVDETLHVTRLISTVRTMPSPFEKQADVDAAIASLLAAPPG